MLVCGGCVSVRSELCWCVEVVYRYGVKCAGVH